MIEQGQEFVTGELFIGRQGIAKMKKLWVVAVSVLALNALGCNCMRRSQPVAAATVCAPVCAPVCTPAMCDPCAQGVTYGMPVTSY